MLITLLLPVLNQTRLLNEVLNETRLLNEVLHQTRLLNEQQMTVGDNVVKQQQWLSATNENAQNDRRRREEEVEADVGVEVGFLTDFKFK